MFEYLKWMHITQGLNSSVPTSKRSKDNHECTLWFTSRSEAFTTIYLIYNSWQYIKKLNLGPQYKDFIICILVHNIVGLIILGYTIIIGNQNINILANLLCVSTCVQIFSGEESDNISWIDLTM
jgi:hypothetical protein